MFFARAVSVSLEISLFCLAFLTEPLAVFIPSMKIELSANRLI
jgi:hypothetical protein